MENVAFRTENGSIFSLIIYRGVGIMVLGIMMLFWNYDAILELWCCYFFRKVLMLIWNYDAVLKISVEVEKII